MLIQTKETYQMMCVLFQACLAAIIIIALKGMFMQAKDLPKLWKIDRIDFVSAHPLAFYDQTITLSE